MDETIDFMDYIVDVFISDGFGVELSQSSDDGIIVRVIVPEYPFHQVSRFFPFNCRPSEAALIYWDLSNSIRRKERHAAKRMA